jgi:hypothetical protein
VRVRHSALSGGFIALAVLLVTLPARAITVYLAPIVYQDECPDTPNAKQPASTLLNELGTKAFGDSVSFRQTGGAFPAPRSFLEAARLSEAQECHYLLYGYIKKNDYAYYAELKLLSRENKELTATFVSGDDAGHYERLVGDLATKVFNYFRDELGLASKADEPAPRRNSLLIIPAAGYWLSAGSEQARTLSGLGSVTAGLRLIPLYPGFTMGSKVYYLSFGLDLEYAIGMSAPNYENAFLHVGRVRLPVEVNCELSDRSTIAAGLGLLFELDMLVQARKYAATYVGTTAAPGATISLSYIYMISPGASIALGLVADLVAYNPLFVSLSPRIFAVFPLGTPIKEVRK